MAKLLIIVTATLSLLLIAPPTWANGHIFKRLFGCGGGGGGSECRKEDKMPAMSTSLEHVNKCLEKAAPEELYGDNLDENLDQAHELLAHFNTLSIDDHMYSDPDVVALLSRLVVIRSQTSDDAAKFCSLSASEMLDNLYKYHLKAQVDYLLARPNYLESSPRLPKLITKAIMRHRRECKSFYLMKFKQTAETNNQQAGRRLELVSSSLKPVLSRHLCSDSSSASSSTGADCDTQIDTVATNQLVDFVDKRMAKLGDSSDVKQVARASSMLDLRAPLSFKPKGDLPRLAYECREFVDQFAQLLSAVQIDVQFDAQIKGTTMFDDQQPEESQLLKALVYFRMCQKLKQDMR